jgi:hypothetical protein
MSLCHHAAKESAMQFLRTEDTRFEGLTDYDFASHRLKVNDTEGGSV